MVCRQPFTQKNLIQTSAKRIIILGKHRGTLGRMPPAAWKDPDAEVWVMAHHWGYIERADRLFESHCEAIVRQTSTEHLKVLKKAATLKPIYTPWKWEESLGPKHIYTPHHALAHISERMESSFGIMLALAIDAAPEVIEMYGIDLKSGSEYQYQRPNGMYMIGKAEGAGIKFILPPNASLFSQSQWKGGLYGSPQDLKTIKYGIKPHRKFYQNYIENDPKFNVDETPKEEGKEEGKAGQ